jgi:hypothetical protein
METHEIKVKPFIRKTKRGIAKAKYVLEALRSGYNENALEDLGENNIPSETMLEVQIEILENSIIDLNHKIAVCEAVGEDVDDHVIIIITEMDQGQQIDIQTSQPFDHLEIGDKLLEHECDGCENCQPPEEEQKNISEDLENFINNIDVDGE